MYTITRPVGPRIPLIHALYLEHTGVKVTKALAAAILANGGRLMPENRVLSNPFRENEMRVILPKGTYKVYKDEYNYDLFLPDGQRIAGEFGGAKAVYLGAVPCTGTTLDTADHSGYLTHADLPGVSPAPVERVS